MTKTELNDIKRIVSFGCSFTAGDELLDHLLSEKFYNLKFKCSSYPEWYDCVRKDKVEYQKLQILREKAAKITYGKKLADMLGADFLNLALSGNSNQHILFQLEEFYQTQFQKGDFILIGLAYPSRILEFDQKNDSRKYNLLQYIESRDIVEFHNNERIIFDHIRDLMCMDFMKRNYFDNHLRIAKMWSRKLIFNDFFLDEYPNNDSKRIFNKSLFDIYESPLFAKTEIAFISLDSTKRLPFGHLPEELHQEFAEQLYKYFIGA